MTLVAIVLLALILLGVAAIGGYVAVVHRREQGRLHRQRAIETLAQLQGIEVALKVGVAAGWIEDTRQDGSAVSIRVR